LYGKESLIKENTENFVDKDGSLLVKEKMENEQSSQTVVRNGAENPENSLRSAEEAAKNQIVAEKPQSDSLSKTERNEPQNTNVVSMDKIRTENSKSSSDSSFDKQEEPPAGKLAQVRNRSRHDRLNFEIRDQRTNTEHTQTKPFMSVETAMGRMVNTSAQEITLELRLSDFNNAGQSAQTTWEAKSSSAMENMLARELHQNFNGDIVRHASMALRDGGESFIKLNLKPEHLGNVKILLEMTENKVTGIILVESEEALNAFRREIASLEQAFKDSGFADANLDLSLSSGGKNAWQEEEKNFASRRASSNYEDSLREIELETGVLFDIYNRDLGSINMLA